MLRSFLMAKVLVLTYSTSNTAYSRLVSVLADGGHTAHGTTQVTASGLNSAFAAASPDVIMTYWTARDAGLRSWVSSKWQEGVPLILGGSDTPSISNTQSHITADLGIMETPVSQGGTISNNIWMHRVSDVNDLMGGLSSMKWSDYSDWYTYSQSGSVYGDVVGSLGDTGRPYMLAVKKGDPLASGFAPANAVFIGWLRGNVPYTVDGAATVQRSVTWAATPSGTPVDFTTTPATADALMHNPAVEAIIDPNFTYNAVVATATAAPVDPAVSTTANVSFNAAVATADGALASPGVEAGTTLVELSPYVYNQTHSTDITTSTTALATNRSVRYYSIRIPRPVLAQDQDVSRITFRLTKVGVNGGAGGAARVYRSVDGVTRGTQIVLKTYDDSNAYETIDVEIPSDDNWIILGVNNDGGAGGFYFDNPGNDNPSYSEQSYFMLDIKKKLVAEPATGTGEMLSATAGVTAGAIITAPAATVSSEMMNGVFPDANTSADLMTANGLMGAAWFKSARKVSAEAATATAEALEIESVVAYRNVIVEAGVAEMSDGWINNPLEVNEDVNDPYWTRVIRKSTDGALPPVDQPFNWFRFNERSGAEVRRYDRISGLPLTGNSSTAPLVGAFSWGAPGPNGRRAVRIENAGINDQRDDAWTTGGQAGDLNLTKGASLEFTVKVAPGHTGRMDIANGTMTPWYSPGTHATSHISIRNGHLYAMTGKGPGRLVVDPETINGKGGTSTRRIDDGKWHHIVITPRPGDYWKHDSGSGIPLDFYIDGVLDRSFMTKENLANAQQQGDPRFFARPDYYFGQETGYPFKGEILEVIFRWSSMNSSQVMDLYLDMFGFKASRAGIVGAAVGAMGDAKVESNMKRMLVLSFGNVPSPGLMQQTNNNKFGVLVNEEHRQNLTEMFVHGQGDDLDIGNYLMSYQQVEYSIAGDPASEMRRDRGDEPFAGSAYQFRDEKTGVQRFIDINRDVNLDNFDVIFVQGYRNPALNTQYERDLFEPFFESLNKALVNGKKLWITDPYLAADLGWVTAVDEVPIIAIGNDVRSYDVAPFPQAIGAGKQPMPRPADGSMPVLPKGLPQGSKWGLYNLWRWDIHHNTGYRVVNEIDGMTNLPSWEVDEMYMRDRLAMLPDNWEWETYGYRLANRSGEDLEWKVKRMNNYIGTDLDDGSGVVFDNVKPSTGTGLKAGDEFYDYVWYEHGYNWFKYASSANYTRGDKARLNRATGTWAIPMGHLKVGTAVSTFRSTMHDDFGREVPNPYRNHIRNAVVRPGDRLPDGRKVMGYALMEFAMRPDVNYLSGRGIEKQLTLPVDEYTAPEDIVQNTQRFILPETPYSFDWDYAHHGRVLFGASGTVSLVSYTSISRTTTRKGTTKISTAWIKRVESLPTAQSKIEWYPIRILPHLDWVSRGLAWLFTVDKVEAEYANYAATAATATGRITGAQIDTEYDNTVTVGAAKASANIVAPAEAQVKEVSVFAAPATATGKMNGIAGGYKAESAQAFVTMPQNVLRPLDIEEVLFFTVTMNQKTINLRMEEN